MLGSMRIPNQMIGKVIGRGGARIKELKDKSGCKISIAKESSCGEQTTEVTLQGSSEEINVAKELISEIVVSNFEFFVPEDKIGLLIGKKGRHIKMIQKLSGAKVVVGRWHNISDSRQKIVRIYGAQESVEKASKLIVKIVNQEFVCGLCMDAVVEKPGYHYMFGILPTCEKCFCNTCIDRWRNADLDEEVVLSCPECCTRGEQKLVIPSDIWLVNPTSKKEFVEDINHNDVSGAVVDIAYEIESENDHDNNDDDDIEESQVEDQVVQIMIEKRCAKKSLTIVQGLSGDHDLKNIVKMAKKKFACNGTVKEHFVYGVIIELQGVQRAEICKLLIQQRLVVREQLKVHDF